MKKNILNCTPHVINVLKNGEPFIDIEPSGIVLRLSQREEVIGEVNGIPLTRQFFGETENLPEEEAGTILIVSRLVADANRSRSDLVVPGPLVRGSDGQPVGCEGLSKV